MSVLEHRNAMAIADEADKARRMGDMALARQLYRRAAVTEQALFWSVPLSRTRTRSILAKSVVWLWFCAGAWRLLLRFAADIRHWELEAWARREMQQAIAKAETERGEVLAAEHRRMRRRMGQRRGWRP